MKQKALMIVFLLMLQAGARAQDKVNFAQMHLSLGYEYMFNTYSRNGSEIGFGFDYNFHKNVYASLLAHYGNYESKGDVIPSDRRQEWAVVAGPGFNIIGNGVDRIYAGLYAGYGVAEASENRYKGEGQFIETIDLGGKGFAAAARLGYEHSFRKFLLGGAVTAWYAGGKLNVSAGLILGVRFR